MKFLLKAKSRLVIHKMKYDLPFDMYIDDVRIIAYYYYILVSMETTANCGMTTDIYDEVFAIRSHASTPNYRCVVTMNTGYSGTHAIEVISENVRITDCGVRYIMDQIQMSINWQDFSLFTLPEYPISLSLSLCCCLGSRFLIYSFMCNVFL